MTRQELIFVLLEKIEVQKELQIKYQKDVFMYDAIERYIRQFLWFIEELKQLNEEIRQAK